MPNKFKRMLVATITVALMLVSSAAAVILSAGKAPTTAVVMLDIIVLLLLSVVLMAHAFADSVRETIYSYANVGYIGGILFFTILIISLIGHFTTQVRSGAFSLRAMFDMLTDFPWQFAEFAVPVMFAVVILLGASNIALIKHEGFRPKNLLSIVLGGLYIGGTVAIWIASLMLERYVFDVHSSKIQLVLNTYIPLFFILMMCYLECILVGCAIMGFVATMKEPEYDKDYIIILGCSIDKRGGLLPLLKGRTNRAIRFAWDQEIKTGKRCLYVPSGGQGPNEIMSEGSAMEFYLLSHGAEPDEIIPEKKSTDTYENFLFSARLIKECNPDAKIAFATTNFHVFRSGIIARMAGVDAEGVSAPTKWYFWPNGFIREFFGILAINKKAHIRMAVLTAVLCIVLGVVSYGWI